MGFEGLTCTLKDALPVEKVASPHLLTHPNLFIGTAGWTYPWRGIFYPEELRSAEFLPFYARHFNATEDWPPT